MSSNPRAELAWVGPQSDRVTPTLTHHARERCKEMGISTKVAKRIWQHRTMTRQVWARRLIVTSTTEPDYAIVVVEPQDWVGGDVPTVPVVVTVLFAVEEEYVREGSTYRVVP